MTFDAIWHSIVNMCQNHPQILIFLSLAIGYYIGRIKFFGFNLGSTTSVLLVALILGQIQVSIPPLIKTIAFSLFIFTIGYKVGPLFFRSFHKNNIAYLFLTIFFAITALATAIILSKMFGFDQGTTAGLLSGSVTQSTIIGTAEDAIRNLSISAAQKNILISNIALAHAITYLFGFAGVILFYKLVPRLLNINLKDEAKKIEAQLSAIEKRKNICHTKKSKATDLAMIGIGCTLGTILGLVTIKIGTIPLTLGISGGVLLTGIFFGWLRCGRIPVEAQWLLTNLGLNVFVACIGLTAGPRAIQALQTQGLSLFFAGVLLALTPHILGIMFGRIVLKFDYVLLLGALAGAGTITPSLQVLKDEAESSIPALGYTVPYALSNFILTIWGTVIVYFMS